MNHEIQAIGHITTPFQQKFAIPRQGQGLSLAKGQINFAEYINPQQALTGIEDFSHLWLMFLFHENLAQGFKQKVRPPRLGGNKKIGVFASRSSFRPNGIGLSLVRNLGLIDNRLHVGEVDLLCNTPIIDIKPYLPYADIAISATAGYAAEKPANTLQITYADSAKQGLNEASHQYTDFMPLLASILAQDPRPAYKQLTTDDKIYHLQLYDYDVHWRMQAEHILVVNVNKVSNAISLK